MILRLLSYPRSLCSALFFPLFTVICSVISILLNIIFNSRKLDDRIICFWGRTTCWMFGVEPKLIHGEKVPVGGCLFVFNHTSFFDIFTMAAVFPGMRFGAKIELFKIPFFGRAMRRAGVLPIDRGHREGVLKIYEDSRERIQRGEKFALAPEGTRQDQEILAPFKSGPFIFAVSAQAPIVPVIIKNARQVLPKHGLLPNWGVWKTEITLEVLDPIYTVGLEKEQRHQLQSQVYDRMKPYFATTQS